MHRRFDLVRAVDHTGVSGVGKVAEGILFSDGSVVLRWLGPYASTVVWRSLEDAMRVHGHDGATQAVFLDYSSDGQNPWVTPFYLWLDFETASLDPPDTTVLEFGWTVTNSEFRQLTPLRSRFSKMVSGSCPAVHPVEIRSGNQGWSVADRVDQVVRDMHRTSGLWREWLETPPFRVIESVTDFDRLLIDDLWAAGWRGTEPVHLAGAGVSHYDRLVIDALGALRVNGKQLLHYRAADTSAAIQILGLQAPKDPDALLELVRFASAEGDVVEEYLLEMLSDDDSTNWLVEYRLDDNSTVSPKALKTHRAASDVAFALVVARCLQALVKRP